MFDFRREIVLVAILKHHAMNSKIHSHAQQESKSSVKEKSSRKRSLHLFGTCWEMINLDVIGFFFFLEKRCNLTNLMEGTHILMSLLNFNYMNLRPLLETQKKVPANLILKVLLRLIHIIEVPIFFGLLTLLCPFHDSCRVDF